MNNIMGAALLGELLGALARSAALRTSLEGVPAEQADAVVRRMVGEIERIAAEGVPAPVPPAPQKPALYPTATPPPRPEEKVRKSFPAPAPTGGGSPLRKNAPEPVGVPTPPPVILKAPASSPRPEPVPSPIVVTQEPVAVPRSEAAPIPIVVPQGPAAVPRPDAAPSPIIVTQEPVAVPRSEVAPSPIVVTQEPVAAPRPAPAMPTRVPPPPSRDQKRSGPPVAAPAPVRARTAPAPIEPAVAEPPSPLRTPSVRVRVPFDDGTAFVLAAALISLQDTPSPDPFGIGEQGVERGSEVFAFDHAGMRFFLSTLRSQEASVSRTGMLLLGKQESIRHRSVHESLANRLRTQSLILPAEPGTVVFGRNDLVRRVDFRRDALFEVLVGLSTLSTWRVHASVVDAHVQKMLPAETAPARTGRQESDRARVSVSTKKTDIKSLERLLNREKKLAEAILQRLAAAADNHTVESMVGLTSGSSEDWKPILKASFDVPAGRFTRFAQAVVDCQETHAMFEPMLSVVGGPGSFSLSM